MALYEVECLIEHPEGDQERVTEEVEADSQDEALETVGLIYPPVRWAPALVDAWVLGPDTGDL